MISKEHTLPRMSDDELRQFILDFLGGQIYCSAHMSEYEMRNLPLVFMPLALGALSEWTEEELKQIGIFWEYLDKAGPRGVNGMPGFFSMRMMHVRDWNRARKVIIREEKRRVELPLDDSEEDELPQERTDLAVALDIAQDGTGDPELLAWALEVLELNGVLTTPRTMVSALPEKVSRSKSGTWSGSRSVSWAGTLSWSGSWSGSRLASRSREDG